MAHKFHPDCGSTDFLLLGTGELFHSNLAVKLHMGILKDGRGERIRLHGLRRTFAAAKYKGEE